jgi:hypothetical protein
MTRLFLPVLAAISLAFAGSAQDKPAGKSDDPIAAELSKAKAEFLSVHERAKDKLLAAFAEEEKKLTNNSKLKIDEKVKRLDQLQDEKKAFEDDGKLPKSPGLKVAVSDYQTKVTAAKLKCEKAFDHAAERYGKKDLAAAKAVLAEKANFLSGVTEPKDTRTRWVGKKQTYFLADKGEWQERLGGGTVLRYKETERTKEYVEAFDASRKIKVRFMDTKAVISIDGGPWGLQDEGGWEPAKKK